MKRWQIAAAGMALLCGLVSFILAGGVARLPSSWRSVLAKGPILVCPARLEVKEAVAGRSTAVEFVVRNEGSAPLRLHRFRTSCACVAIERKVLGAWQRCQEERIDAGDDCTFRLLLVGRIMDGTGTRQYVIFQSNDAATPEHRLEVLIDRILGGVSSVPSELSLGKLILGKNTRATVQLVDPSPHPRQVTAVRPNMQGLSASFFPAASPARVPGGLHLGDVQVDVQAAPVGMIRGEIQVEFEGEKLPLLIPVHADICPPVEVIPNRLTLPRHGRTGPVFTASLMCFAHQGKLRKIEVPKHALLAARLLDDAAGERCRLQVQLLADHLPVGSTEIA